MNKSPQYHQQSKSEVEEIVIYQNMESGRHSISENKGCVFHPRKNPKQQYLKEATFSDPSFGKKRIYVYIQPYCLNNTLNRQSSA